MMEPHFALEAVRDPSHEPTGGAVALVDPMMQRMPEVHPPFFVSATPRAQGAPVGWHVPVEAPGATTERDTMMKRLEAIEAENHRLQALLAGSVSAAPAPVTATPPVSVLPPAPVQRQASVMSNASMGVPDTHITTITPQLAKHPILKTMTPAGRRELLYAYMAYRDQIAATTGANFQAFIMPVSQCISFELRKRIARWFFNKQPHQLSEDDWIAWVNSAFDNAASDIINLKKVLKRDLKMNMSLSDGEARIIDLMEQVSVILTKQDHEWVFQHEQKMLIAVMTHALKPALFKESIEAALLLTQNKLYKKDLLEYSWWLRTAARSFQPFAGAYGDGSGRTNTTGDGNGDGGRGNGNGGRGNGNGGRGNGNGGRDNGGRGNGNGGRGNNPKSASTEEKKDANGNVLRLDGSVRKCLRCKKADHGVFQCPLVKDKEEAKALMKKFRENGNKIDMLSNIQPVVPGRPRSSASILVEGVVRIVNAIVSITSQYNLLISQPSIVKVKMHISIIYISIHSSRDGLGNPS
jgi:hypothetical protein